MSVGALTPVERRAFDLNTLPAVDREAAWRDTAVAGFDATGLPSDIAGRAWGAQLGPVRFTDSVHPTQTLTRTAARTRRDGVDAIMCSLELSAGFGAVIDGEEVEVAPAQVSFFDLGRPVAKIAGEGRTVCLTIERAALEQVLPSLDGLHGLTLGGAGALAADHLSALMRSLPQLPAAAAAGVGRATVELLAACVKPSMEALERVQPLVAAGVMRRIDVFIASRLDDPDLSPEQIARGVAMSRASLYRLLEPSGGVAAHVRGQRLKAAHRMLLDPDGSLRVGEVAYRVGFKSESSFSRAFRAAFGATPGDVRMLGRFEAMRREPAPIYNVEQRAA